MPALKSNHNTSPLTNMLGVTLINVIAHNTAELDPTDSAFFLEFIDGLTVSNCVAYSAGNNTGNGVGHSKDDGYHIGSVRNFWVLNCTAYLNDNQGFDFSRDGSFKTQDWGFNGTARNCMAYSNFDNGLDFNSGARNIIYINCVSDTTTDPTLGSPNFNVHQGTQGSNWWINCTSTRSVDRGWSFSWDGNPWSIPAGTYYQFMINCISSGDSLYELTNSPGSAGPSLVG